MAEDGVLVHNRTTMQMVVVESSAVEDSFANRFTTWCAAHTECALQGQDVLAVFDQLTAKADVTPIPAPG